MKKYESKQELINTIKNTLNSYLSEFDDILENEKDRVIIGVDKTPAQNISYQLGWVSLLLDWEKNENAGHEVSMPKIGYKWNNLGALYQEFYQTYALFTLNEMITLLSCKVDELVAWIDQLTDEELFLLDQRKWATTPAQWPVYKWIHINTVAPFSSFKAKIRKWKKLRNQSISLQKPQGTNTQLSD